MTEPTEILTGACTECGAEVRRQRMTGRFATLANDAPFVCDACIERLDTDDAEDKAAARRERRLNAADLPAGLADVDLAALSTDGCAAALDAAVSWAAGMVPGVMLVGPIGAGKTTIAAGALRARLEHGPGRWWFVPLLMARLGSGLGSPQRDDALASLTEGRGALVLDDIDKARPTEYGAEQIFLAVDNAVTGKRPLMVTTNLTPDGIAARWPDPFGSAIASRLVGYCATVEVAGRDRRLERAA